MCRQRRVKQPKRVLKEQEKVPGDKRDKRDTFFLYTFFTTGFLGRAGGVVLLSLLSPGQGPFLQKKKVEFYIVFFEHVSSPPSCS